MNDVNFSDLEQLQIRVSRPRYFSKADIIQIGAFHIVQLQRIHLLKLSINVPLTRLVITVIINTLYCVVYAVWPNLYYRRNIKHVYYAVSVDGQMADVL